jgi:protocatechuate 3,4-dioxygenase beta subunit
MKKVFSASFVILSLLMVVGCEGQNTPSASKQIRVGGACEGCEAMYVGIPEEIKAVDTSAGWYEAGQKLWITGKVLQPDGKTPADGVIIYYYQTDNEGRYSAKPVANEQTTRHGHIRGWVKTDAGGNYSVYTIVPAPYPGRNTPAHIHILIKEPHLANEYYIDDLVFDDDPLLTSRERRAMNNKGGNGILRVVHKDSLQIAEHDIILGMNIAGYPAGKKETLVSGLHVGEESPSFMPYHAWGRDKGTRACPLCKYGRYMGILYFVGDHPNWNDIKKWLTFLESESIHREQFLKVFFVYGKQDGYSKEERIRELEKLGRELHLQKVALTFVPALNDAASEVNLYKISPEAENTFIVYRHRKIVYKHINLKPGTENFQMMSAALDKATSPFFNLPATAHD